MQTDYLIIGSGIAGALLSYELIQNGASVVVADHNDELPKASRVAGAVINPLNISKWNFVKDHERYIREALLTYTAIEKLLNIHILHRHTNKKNCRRGAFNTVHRSNYDFSFYNPDLAYI